MQIWVKICILPWWHSYGNIVIHSKQRLELNTIYKHQWKARSICCLFYLQSTATHSYIHPSFLPVSWVEHESLPPHLVTWLPLGRGHDTCVYPCPALKTHSSGYFWRQSSRWSPSSELRLYSTIGDGSVSHLQSTERDLVEHNCIPADSKKFNSCNGKHMAY